MERIYSKMLEAITNTNGDAIEYMNEYCGTKVAIPK